MATVKATMLNDLLNIEKELARHLAEEDTWSSVYVDYHKPYVKRLWKQIGTHRVYLHQIASCERSESLFHPHPWPSAMKVIEGVYEMGVGYSKTNEAPVAVSTLILPKNSYYEMVDIDSWHYVRPLSTVSYSLMLTGAPWRRDAPKSDYPLRQLGSDEKRAIFDLFRKEYC